MIQGNQHYNNYGRRKELKCDCGNTLFSKPKLRDDTYIDALYRCNDCSRVVIIQEVHGEFGFVNFKFVTKELIHDDEYKAEYKKELEENG